MYMTMILFNQFFDKTILYTNHTQEYNKQILSELVLNMTRAFGGCLGVERR